eukprot:g4999.t1
MNYESEEDVTVDDKPSKSLSIDALTTDSPLSRLPTMCSLTRKKSTESSLKTFNPSARKLFAKEKVDFVSTDIGKTLSYLYRIHNSRRVELSDALDEKLIGINSAAVTSSVSFECKVNMWLNSLVNKRVVNSVERKPKRMKKQENKQSFEDKSFIGCSFSSDVHEEKDSLRFFGKDISNKTVDNTIVPPKVKELNNCVMDCDSIKTPKSMSDSFDIDNLPNNWNGLTKVELVNYLKYYELSTEGTFIECLKRIVSHWSIQTKRVDESVFL